MKHRRDVCLMEEVLAFTPGVPGPAGTITLRKQ